MLKNRRSMLLPLIGSVISQLKWYKQRNLLRICAARQKLKWKDWIQQVWRGAKFHKCAHLAVVPHLCWIKLNGFVNPRITDFLTTNWNKVINWYDLVTCSQEKKKCTKHQCRTPTHLRGQCCTAAKSGGGTDGEARWGDKRRCTGLWGAAQESQMKKTTLKRWKKSERDAASIRLSAQACLIKYTMPFEVVEYSWSTEKQG